MQVYEPQNNKWTNEMVSLIASSCIVVAPYSHCGLRRRLRVLIECQAGVLRGAEMD
jgi:hypothetical protein